MEIMDFINPVVELESVMSSDDDLSLKEMTVPELKTEVSDYIVESLEEWAEIMHNEIKITDFHRGWFSKHKNCFLGGEVFGWLLDKVVPDQKRARQYCQKMLDLKIIESVDNKTQFSLTEIYRFYFDSMDVADNLVRTWK
jgi:hypothetical protein